MTYQESVDWLFNQLPMYQNIGSKALSKIDLTKITDFCAYLGNPQHKFKSIHVAGTNGKGSTSHMIASVLQEAGFKTGLLTSPHLKDFRERIRINGQLCTESFVIDFVVKHQDKIKSLNASFFEINVAMAFEYFAMQEVDFAVIETGLGGRLDSTNIINPIVSVITNIGLEHTQYLGDTLEKIAYEKAGIIKENTPVVIGEMLPETKPVFVEIAHKKNALILFAEAQTFPEYKTDLKGNYQQKNKRTALTVFEILKDMEYDISFDIMQEGLLNVVKNTGLRGRWDILGTNPLIVADTAHNPHGLEQVNQQIHKTPYETLHLVLGFVNDKDVIKGLSYFPKDAVYYFSEPALPRKYPVEKLKEIVPKELNSKYFTSVQVALDAARANAGKNDFIYIGGSTFVVAEVI